MGKDCSDVESPREASSSSHSTADNAQREVQDCRESELMRNIFYPRCYPNNTNILLPRFSLTNCLTPDNAQTPAKKQLSDIVRANKSVFDPDQDGYISQVELAKAVSNSRLDKNVAAAVVALVKNYDALSDLSSEGILSAKSLTLKDIDEYSKMAKATGEKTRDQQELIDQVNLAQEQTRVQAESISQDLFGPNDEISPKSVQQGRIGDCSFLAILTGMAGTKPGRELIRKMIQPDGSGFIVNFPNGESTRVEKPTAAELTLYAGNNGNGIWPAVLEKAYGKLLAVKNNGDEETPQLAADGCEKFIPHKTLSDDKPLFQSIEPGKLDVEELHQQLIDVSRHTIFMTAGTGGNPEKMTKEGNPPKADLVDSQGNPIPNQDPVDIIGPHVYAVDRYDAESRMVYLRNPHDGGQLLRVSLETYRQAFVAMGAMHEERLLDQPVRTATPGVPILA